jgi:hypothetical protein
MHPVTSLKGLEHLQTGYNQGLLSISIKIVRLVEIRKFAESCYAW